MKAEASGFLKVNAEMVARLGLQGLTPAQCKVASALWLTKPVVPTEAALHVLRIPIVSMSKKVVSINTAPPEIRVRRVSPNSDHVCIPQVEHYMGRPATPDIEKMTMIQ